MSISAFVTIVLSATALTNGQKCPDASQDGGACAFMQQTYSKGNNQLTLDFYKATVNSSSTTSTTNLIMTPAALASSLFAACAAAEGVTQSEIKKALYFGGDCWDGVKASMGYFYSDAAHSSGDPGFTGLDDVVGFASSFFIDMSLKTKPEFAAKNQAKFNQTVVGMVPFATNPEKARADLNKWVSGRTNGTVKELITKESATPTTKLLIVNALYVAYNWAIQFDPKLNTVAQFTNVDGSKSDVTFMNLKAKTLKYFDNTNGDQFPGVPSFQLLILGDKWGFRSFMIFLPKDITGLSALETALTDDVINQAADKAKRTVMDVAVPKFSIKRVVDAKEVLQKLGIKKLFTNDAELQAMLNKPVAVDSLVHQASIIFQEKGLETATGAVLSTGTRTSLTNAPVVFKVDRPFFFINRAEDIKSFTHIGRVVKL